MDEKEHYSVSMQEIMPTEEEDMKGSEMEQAANALRYKKDKLVEEIKALDHERHTPENRELADQLRSELSGLAETLSQMDNQMHR